jgi:hypothetical protein
VSISLRTTIESLLLGTAGTTRTMASGRFRLRAPDGALEDHPANAAERTVEVVISPAEHPFGWNGLDGFVIQQSAMTVRVGYLYTNAGGDQAEALTEQSGAATLDVIRDRAATDAHAIDVVLQWHENYSGTDPAIISINKSGPPSPVAIVGDRAVLEIPYVITSKATLPGSGYEP